MTALTASGGRTASFFGTRSPREHLVFREHVVHEPDRERLGAFDLLGRSRCTTAFALPPGAASGATRRNPA